MARECAPDDGEVYRAIVEVHTPGYHQNQYRYEVDPERGTDPWGRPYTRSVADGFRWVEPSTGRTVNGPYRRASTARAQASRMARYFSDYVLDNKTGQRLPVIVKITVERAVTTWHVVPETESGS